MHTESFLGTLVLVKSISFNQPFSKLCAIDSLIFNKFLDEKCGDYELKVALLTGKSCVQIYLGHA